MSELCALQIYHGYPELLNIEEEYVRALAPRVRETVVVILKKKADASIRARISAEHVYFLDLKNSELSGMAGPAVRKLLAICERHKPDILIAHRYKPTFVAGLLHRRYRFRAPMAVLHGLHQFDTFMRRLGARWFLRRDFTLLGVSDASVADLRKRLPFHPEARLATLHNCLPVSELRAGMLARAAARRELGLPEQAFVFGTIGRLVPAKDHASLVRAFAAHAEHDADAYLCIIGEGRLRETLSAQIAALPCRDRIVLAGNRPEAYRLLPAFDRFVLSSVNEGFGLVLLEAMCAELPLICTDAGGIGEVVGDACPLLPPGNAKVLAEAMRASRWLDEASRAQQLERQAGRLAQFEPAQFSARLWQLLDSRLVEDTRQEV